MNDLVGINKIIVCCVFRIGGIAGNNLRFGRITRNNILLSRISRDVLCNYEFMRFYSPDRLRLGDERSFMIDGGDEQLSNILKRIEMIMRSKLV